MDSKTRVNVQVDVELIFTTQCQRLISGTDINFVHLSFRLICALVWTLKVPYRFQFIHYVLCHLPWAYDKSIVNRIIRRWIGLELVFIIQRVKLHNQHNTARLWFQWKSIRSSSGLNNMPLNLYQKLYVENWNLREILLRRSFSFMSESKLDNKISRNSFQLACGSSAFVVCVISRAEIQLNRTFKEFQQVLRSMQRHNFRTINSPISQWNSPN